MRTFILLITFLTLHHHLNAQEPIKMREFFGVNTGFGQNPDRPDDIRDLVGWIREYSKWVLFEPENDQFRFRNDTLDNDSLYRHIRKIGIKTLMVIQKSPKWISSGTGEDFDAYAPSGKENGLKPEHYKEAAEFYYQLAARYGSKEIESKKLKTDDKISGLNLINSLGVLNEADGAFEWGNRIQWEQYAALLNAVYDGNQGTLGPGYGIKDADPDLPVSVSGLAFNLPSLISLHKYAGRIPFDIINVHFYAFRYTRPTNRVAVPPEWSSLEDDMKDIVLWRNENAPDKPIWLTEIGWDTKSYSTEGVGEEEAASYLIRSFLLTKGAGIDKAFWFYFRDLDDLERKGVFSTSGLFENATIPYAGDTQLSPKLTYWYYGTMTSQIGDLIYAENLSENTTYHYRFESENQNRKTEVLWYCPQFHYAWRQLVEYPTTEKYMLQLPPEATNIQIIKPAGGSFQGIPQPLKYHQDLLELELTGTPIFVSYDLK